MKNINVVNNIINEILLIKERKDMVFVSLCGSADTGKTTLAERICSELNRMHKESNKLSTDSFLIDREERKKKDLADII
ncbi:MAG: hypothetical protein WCL51_06600 [Bacteroidota bacterium]